jgi:hypothetical protein
VVCPRQCGELTPKKWLLPSVKRARFSAASEPNAYRWKASNVSISSVSLESSDQRFGKIRSDRVMSWYSEKITDSNTGSRGFHTPAGCRISTTPIGCCRMTMRYQTTRADDAGIRQRMKAIAQERRRFGYRRLHVLLKREGYVINHKRLFRLYREEKLAVRHRGGRKRELVDKVRSDWKVSIRRACSTLRIDRALHVYKSKRGDQAALKSRIKDICETRLRYGYRRVHVLLQRDGWAINVKRVYRLYRELSLQLRHKTPKRRVRAKLREDRTDARQINET